jgi:hypothetical protein
MWRRIENSGAELGTTIRSEAHRHTQFHEITYDGLHHFTCSRIASPLMNHRLTG